MSHDHIAWAAPKALHPAAPRGRLADSERWLAAPRVSATTCVPSMTAGLEVEVLRGPGRGDPSEAQGLHREVATERSVKRIRGLTYRNRIGGVHGRASGHVTAKLWRPHPASVNPAVVRRRAAVLPGEVSPYARKGDAAKSRGARSQQRP